MKTNLYSLLDWRFVEFEGFQASDSGVTKEPENAILLRTYLEAKLSSTRKTTSSQEPPQLNIKHLFSQQMAD
jgi:hypothetical protein